MKHIPFSLIALAMIATAALGDEPKPSTPNIVFILADDLGYGDLGCYNANSKIPTPNLDRLAAQGIHFTDAHAPTSVCSPTRYAILTGRYAWRSRLHRGVLVPWEGPLIDRDRLTVPSLLKQHGYSTAAIGKWHLGMTWPTKDGKPPHTTPDHLSNVDFTQPITDGPITRGFDSYFGTDVPNYPPYCFVENDHSVGIPTVPGNKGDAGGLNHPGPVVPGWEFVNILPELTRRAVKQVEESAKSGKPFFLYFALTSPHFPVVPAPEFKGKSKAGDYGDYVVQTDWTVGQVLDALQRSGVADNTLVIFTSDNGPEITGEVTIGAYDRAEKFGHYSMGDLRGAKRDTWEGGQRVPFLARWPGKIAADSTSRQIICHVDFMATVAAMLDIKLPDNAGEDSFNLLPVLLGKADGPVRPAVVHHSGSGKFAIRMGDWVLIDTHTGDDNGKKGEPKWFKQQRGYIDDNLPGQLFNVHDDTPERKNQFVDHPEIVKELKELLEQYKRDGRSTPGKPQKNDGEVRAAPGRQPPEAYVESE
jgi:arylsulfatase A-like enzyme